MTDTKTADYEMMRKQLAHAGHFLDPNLPDSEVARLHAQRIAPKPVDKPKKKRAKKKAATVVETEEE